MKFSVNWLREFVDLPTEVERLAELLTLAGVEIEGIDPRGGNFDKVIVAQIKSSAPHPNAERLTVCQVDDGSGHLRQIVCGAKNYRVGDKVPLALPGAILPNDLRIRTSKLRGVESDGMMCSGKELAISEESDGLLILGQEAEVGQPMANIFPADTILEVEITPNRGDLLSHFGLAREIAALTGVPLTRQPESSSLVKTAPQGIQITAPAECPFYSARRIENITVGPTPEWIRRKIEAVGVRSINNIVDITNFVMLELGQPLHAFDADKLQGAINVRLAGSGEKFLALDGKNYSLGQESLIIADSSRAIAIGGVMGGEETGVTNETRNLILESAYFLPSSVRRTARQLGLPSDASYRFERGVDPAMVLAASARATELIREFAGGKPVAEIATGGSLPAPPSDVKLRYQRCHQLLGVTIDPAKVDQTLERFGLEKSSGGKNDTVWRIPSHRCDLTREVDLIEEVVRVFGIDQVPSRDRSRFTPVSEADSAFDLEARVRQRLLALGISEARTSALIPRNANQNAFGGDALALRNPLSEDHVALRPSLLPGLLAAVARNLRAGAQSVRLFELGRVFGSKDGKEARRLSLVFSGAVASRPHWRGGSSRALDFFDVKGALETIGPISLSLRRIEHPDLALAAEIQVLGQPVGFIGQMTAERTAEIDARKPVIVTEIDFDIFFRRELRAQSFREMEKFPSVTRDIAMVVPDKLSHAEILAVIEKEREPLLERVELFDLFGGEQAKSFGTERKSLAYTLTYRDKNRTLTSEEVTAVHARIRERLQRELAVELRE